MGSGKEIRGPEIYNTADLIIVSPLILNYSMLIIQFQDRNHHHCMYCHGMSSWRQKKNQDHQKF